MKHRCKSTPLSVLSFCAVRSLVAGVLEEVTVTAQKREQSLRDVGIAVTAFTGEQI